MPRQGAAIALSACKALSDVELAGQPDRVATLEQSVRVLLASPVRKLGDAAGSAAMTLAASRTEREVDGMAARVADCQRSGAARGRSEVLDDCARIGGTSSPRRDLIQ